MSLLVVIGGVLHRRRTALSAITQGAVLRLSDSSVRPTKPTRSLLVEEPLASSLNISPRPHRSNAALGKCPVSGAASVSIVSRALLLPVCTSRPRHTTSEGIGVALSHVGDARLFL